MLISQDSIDTREFKFLENTPIVYYFCLRFVFLNVFMCSHSFDALYYFCM